MVQGLGFCASTAGGTGSSPGWGTKVLHAVGCAQTLSWVPLFGTPQVAAHQASLSMGFSRQEYWSGWPFPTPGCGVRRCQKTNNKKKKPYNDQDPTLAGGRLLLRAPPKVRLDLGAPAHCLVKVAFSIFSPAGQSEPGCV